jgi:hypothetical protein
LIKGFPPRRNRAEIKPGAWERRIKEERMKYIKLLGLAAVAAAALMAFVGAGTASAQGTITCSEGVACPNGTTIEATSTHVTLHPPFGEITCTHSRVHGFTTSATTGNVGTLTFGNAERKCGIWTIHVLKTGTLHTETGGILKGAGQEVTVEGSGVHCTFGTGAGTKLGTVTPSSGGTKAVLDIEAKIPVVGGRSGIFCGTTAQWTGKYTVLEPTPFFKVD